MVLLLLFITRIALNLVYSFPPLFWEDTNALISLATGIHTQNFRAPHSYNSYIKSNIIVESVLSCIQSLLLRIIPLGTLLVWTDQKPQSPSYTLVKPKTGKFLGSKVIIGILEERLHCDFIIACIFFSPNHIYWI